MSNIDSSFRTPFFPRKGDSVGSSKTSSTSRLKPLNRNSYERANEISGRTSSDARVGISDAVKDFSRIKKVVDAAPERDNSAKIARLRQQIQSGTYEVDYDALADKILESEF